MIFQYKFRTNIFNVRIPLKGEERGNYVYT